jgi:hypothetical protein
MELRARTSAARRVVEDLNELLDEALGAYRSEYEVERALAAYQLAERTDHIALARQVLISLAVARAQHAAKHHVSNPLIYSWDRARDYFVKEGLDLAHLDEAWARFMRFDAFLETARDFFEANPEAKYTDFLDESIRTDAAWTKR